jgi:hypothetical protein
MGSALLAGKGFVLQAVEKRTHLDGPLYFSAMPPRRPLTRVNPPILTASKNHAVSFSYLKAALRVAHELHEASGIAFFAAPLQDSVSGSNTVAGEPTT